MAAGAPEPAAHVQHLLWATVPREAQHLINEVVFGLFEVLADVAGRSLCVRVVAEVDVLTPLRGGRVGSGEGRGWWEATAGQKGEGRERAVDREGGEGKAEQQGEGGWNGKK